MVKFLHTSDWKIGMKGGGLAAAGAVVAEERIRSVGRVLEIATEEGAAFVLAAGDLFEDTGAGKDAMAQYMALMADLEQLAPIGTVWSYNNAGFYLAGYVIEQVTGQSYEAAMVELVFEPLGLEHCLHGLAVALRQRTATPPEVLVKTPLLVTHDYDIIVVKFSKTAHHCGVRGVCLESLKLLKIVKYLPRIVECRWALVASGDGIDLAGSE